MDRPLAFPGLAPRPTPAILGACWCAASCGCFAYRNLSREVAHLDEQRGQGFLRLGTLALFPMRQCCYGDRQLQISVQFTIQIDDA
jgi:hypothetical protein